MSIECFLTKEKGIQINCDFIWFVTRPDKENGRSSLWKSWCSEVDEYDGPPFWSPGLPSRHWGSHDHWLFEVVVCNRILMLLTRFFSSFDERQVTSVLFDWGRFELWMPVYALWHKIHDQSKYWQTRSNSINAVDFLMRGKWPPSSLIEDDSNYGCQLPTYALWHKMNWPRNKYDFHWRALLMYDWKFIQNRDQWELDMITIHRFLSHQWL